MSRATSALSGAALLTAVVLTIAGCGGASSGSGGSASAGASSALASAAGGGNTSGSGSGGSGAAASCSHGLQAGVNGVVDIECGGPAAIHITAGSVSESITGGTCRQAGSTWSVTAGVVTQYGIYTGPPVDVVSVAATVGKDASIQAELDGKNLIVDSASFALSAAGKSAHLAGTSDRNADIANTPVTVDVTC